MSDFGRAREANRDEALSRLMSHREVGVEFIQFNYCVTKAHFFYALELYTHSTNHTASFRAYASRDNKSVEPDE